MRTFLTGASLFALFLIPPAEAQLQPQEVTRPSVTVKAPKGFLHHRVSNAPMALAPPSAETIIGRDLLLGGAKGLLRFSGQADALQIERFSMAGEVISNPTQQCQIEIVGDATIKTKSLGRPDGLLRFSANIPACPFEFDVLDGAVLVPPQIQACVFKEADCQANPSGLWGPDGAGLVTDARAKKEARASAESNMNANRQALAARLNDQSRTDALADEQSRFLADRDEICHGYLREDLHWFCAIQLTEARAAFLKARLDELPGSVGEKTSVGPHRRRTVR